MTSSDKKYITLKDLQLQVKRVLSQEFALPVWVSAEISDLKVNYSGHCYMELIEKGQNDSVAAAQARAVIWRSVYPRLASEFEQATGSRLGAGIRILCKVLVTYHEIYGFSLQIVDIDPAYTLGDMERRRQETISQLQKEGVWDLNHEQEYPPLVQRIAIISSEQAAGYRDFVKEISKYDYAFALTLYDAFMQGVAAEESIIEALCRIAEEQDKYDAVVIIRGGGSRSDLNCFDSYRLCSYIAQFPLPILTGIGHDKDVSVADMVAKTPLKTPTAVAGWLVERMAERESELETAALQLSDLTRTLLHASEIKLERALGDLKKLSTTLLTRHTLRLEQISTQLPEWVRGFLLHRQEQLRMAEELIESRSPKEILRLGFAIVRTKEKKVAMATDVEKGERLEIELSDGQINVTVEDKEIWLKKE